MTKRIFHSTLAVGLAVLVTSLAVVLGCLYDYYVRLQESQLRDELSIAAAAVEGQGKAYLSKLSSDHYRITWVKADGTVLYDTRADAAAMENHAQRQEVQQALTTGVGESSRYSATLLEKTLYYARRLPDGTVLRLSATRVTWGVLLLSMLQPLLLVLVVALILSGLLARRVSRRIVEPLNRLDLEHPLDNDAYEELSPLLRRLEHQRRQIDDQLRDLRRQSEKFQQVTANMNEGLVLLDEGGMVLSLNPAACRIFQTDDGCVGKDFLTVEREPAVSRALRDASAQGHGEARLARDGHEYQFDVTANVIDGERAGAVLLAFDVTEQAFAERNRREFTANVSHELKTPLTSISGFAEIIQNGIVKAEDIPRFAGNIYMESQRLISLVDDILNLSRLDEADVQLEWEDFDLSALSRDVAARLKPAAKENGVVITTLGDKAVIHGVKSIVDEMVYNLVDNAVKYNKKNGRVTINVEKTEAGTALTVMDTGIGVPQADVDRVFERFYRVDKSHSQEIGGTGLGLSIVKHGAAFHNAQVSLESTEGQGTVIRLVFPN